MTLDQIKSWRCSLLVLIFVPERSFLDVELESVKLTIESMSILAGTLHGIVTEEV